MPPRKNNAARKGIMQSKKWIIGALACWCLTGCAVGPDYHPVETKMPEGFVAASSGLETSKPVDQAVIDATKWWKSLNDPELNSLIDHAIANSPDLEIMLDRVQEARTQEEIVLGGALPEADFSASTATGTGSDLTKGRADSPLRAGDNGAGYSKIKSIAGFDSSYELDLFGQYRREMEAAEYDTQATIAARNNVLITVIADVARAYIDMRAEQMQLAVLQKNADNLKDYVTLTQERFDRGITNELDLTLAQRQYASLEAEKAPIAAQVRAAQYVIATLLGQFPEDMAKELDRPGMVPALPDNIAAGLPLDLLRRRPDIQEAEREAAAATARIGVAEADLFPHVALAGGAGLQGGQLSGSANPASFIWSLGPSVSWSILDFGTLDALVDKADLHAKETLVQYRKTVLNAVREVDGSLDAYKAQEDRLNELGNALVASKRAVELSTKRFNRGLTDSLNVIDAERQEYDLEAQYVTAQQNAAEQFIALYKSLGGGWEPYQVFPPIHQPLPAVAAAFASLVNSHDPQKE
jgi:NodT family efflux transporter outer membrane factor (OMF) lipoprotein